MIMFAVGNILFLCLGVARIPSTAVPPERLFLTLKQASEYCDRVKRTVCKIACEERILEKKIDPFQWTPWSKKKIRRMKEIEYVYQYRWIYKRDRLRENRILLKENGEPREQEHAVLKVLGIHSLRPMISPVGFIGKDAEKFYDYEWLGEKKIFDRKASVLRSRPKAGKETPKDYGRIWVDSSTGAVLRIELEQECVAGFDDLKAWADKNKLRPFLSAVYDFGIEKNGICFPSRTEIEESYAGPGYPKNRWTNVAAEYSHYDFFLIKTKKEKNGFDRRTNGSHS
jgi:hypothetical protein